MQPDLLHPLKLFLDQSRRLLELAEEGDWAAFETRLAERQLGLANLGDNALLIGVAKAGLADEMRQLIADIQSVNDRIGEVAERERTDLAAQLRQSYQAEKAIDAYKK